MENKNQPPKKSRGRPRAYDPEQALEAAMRTFWKSGYSGTSLDDLCAAMQMNRPSLYAGFGDKQHLYLQAMQRFQAHARQHLSEALAPAWPSRSLATSTPPSSSTPAAAPPAAR